MYSKHAHNSLAVARHASLSVDYTSEGGHHIIEAGIEWSFAPSEARLLLRRIRSNV
jgi:hypothetical protein